MRHTNRMSSNKLHSSTSRSSRRYQLQMPAFPLLVNQSQCTYTHYQFDLPMGIWNHNIWQDNIWNHKIWFSNTSTSTHPEVKWQLPFPSCTSSNLSSYIIVDGVMSSIPLALMTPTDCFMVSRSRIGGSTKQQENVLRFILSYMNLIMNLIHQYMKRKNQMSCNVHSIWPVSLRNTFVTTRLITATSLWHWLHVTPLIYYVEVDISEI